MNCNGEGGWTRIAFVDMSEPGETCPTGLTQVQESNLTLCSREINNPVQSAFFTTHEIYYSAVCGRVRGYQFGQPCAFENGGIIDNPYAEGVSITYSANP